MQVQKDLEDVLRRPNELDGPVNPDAGALSGPRCPLAVPVDPHSVGCTPRRQVMRRSCFRGLTHAVGRTFSAQASSQKGASLPVTLDHRLGVAAGTHGKRWIDV